MLGRIMFNRIFFVCGLSKTDPTPRCAREATRKHRAEMRRRGFKMIHLWVPDPDAPGFAAEMRRQSLAAANDPAEQHHLEMLDDAADDLERDPEWK